MTTHTIELEDMELERVLICVDEMRLQMEDSNDDDAADVFWSDMMEIVEQSEHDEIEDIAGLMVDMNAFREPEGPETLQ